MTDKKHKTKMTDKKHKTKMTDKKLTKDEQLLCDIIVFAISMDLLQKEILKLTLKDLG